ncbi:MAG TPA: pilus assembly protein PilM [Sedimentisphaerales bacterium]|nr:pilus assembly protein PilM [Sedimentisphaerales bacterium]
MLKSKTALGIDISDGRISLALLRQNAKGIELLKAASSPVPDGAIKDGNVEDSVKLSQAIKGLRVRKKIRGIIRTSVSLLTKPAISQILDIPKGAPTNIGRLVQNELKSCVALSGKEIAFDFCRIKSRQGQGSRLLAVATDSRKVAKLAEACSRAGLNAEVIEPPLLAYARALYAKKIEGRFDCNVLIVILRDGVLTLCVFRKQTLDFVGTRSISREKAEPDELCRWLAEEINAIIRFYDIEVADSSGKWEVTVVAGSIPLPDDAEQSLRAKITSASLQVRTDETICQDTLVAQDSSTEKPSVVAIGLAMRLLNKNGDGLRVNLLPPESAEVKSVKKHFLITANIIAAVLIPMIFAAGGLSMMTNKVNQNITHKKQTELSQDTYILLREQESLDRQIGLLSERPARLKDILDSRYSLDWAGILEDVRSRTPGAVRITNLYSKGNTEMHLEGLALSYEVVRLFVKMLNESDYISSASLNMRREDKAGGLVVYTINCSLTREKKNS